MFRARVLLTGLFKEGHAPSCAIQSKTTATDAIEYIDMYNDNTTVVTNTIHIYNNTTITTQLLQISDIYNNNTTTLTNTIDMYNNNKTTVANTTDTVKIHKYNSYNINCYK